MFLKLTTRSFGVSMLVNADQIIDMFPMDPPLEGTKITMANGEIHDVNESLTEIGEREWRRARSLRGLI